MGIESLIPFGLDTETQKLVDVGSVSRGTACNCICPSCKTPLTARQGDVNEWHFAHQSRGSAHDKTRNECEFSFPLSVRLMIRQISKNGLYFKTPSLSLKLYSRSYPVTDESYLKLDDVQIGANFSNVTVDILGLVEGVPLIVFITYKNREVPLELHTPSEIKCGVIELNINSLPSLFKAAKNGLYQEVLRDFLEHKLEGKSWVYHPRSSSVEDKVINEQEKYLFNEEYEEKGFITLDSYYKNLLTIHNQNQESSFQKIYVCRMCNKTWEGHYQYCETCKTHLYATEQG